MKDSDTPRDYLTKPSWIHLQQEIVEAGTEESNVEIDQNHTPGHAPFQLTIEMNDSRSRLLHVFCNAEAEFKLVDFRLRRVKVAEAHEVLELCKSWMDNSENMKTWFRLPKLPGK